MKESKLKFQEVIYTWCCVMVSKRPDRELNMRLFLLLFDYCSWDLRWIKEYSLCCINRDCQTSYSPADLVLGGFQASCLSEWAAGKCCEALSGGCGFHDRLKSLLYLWRWVVSHFQQTAEPYIASLIVP